MKISIKTPDGILILVTCLIVTLVFISQATKKLDYITQSVQPSSQLAQVSGTASLSLSPSTNSISINNTFTVNILLNTGGSNSYGVDINSLHFNPGVLQVVDADTTIPGVQIASGSLMTLGAVNDVNNSTGVIQFSQLANYTSTFNGSGIIATITFKPIAAGTSNVTFDFIFGSGADSNVAGLGGDLLSSVSGGTYTGIASDATLPSAPGTPTLTVMSATQINLSWTASTDNIAVSGYKVERCSGSACSAFAQIATPSANSYSNAGLLASTVYNYRIRAVDTAGNLSPYSSSASATTGAPLDTTAPTISAITFSGITTSSVTITWTTANEISDTQVQYGLTTAYSNQTTLKDSPNATPASARVTSHTVTLTGLSAGTNYHYQVKSRDVVGNLATSPDNVFTTQKLADTTAPVAPGGLTVNPTSESQIQLSWTASTDPAGAGQNISGVASYQVFRGVTPIGTTTSTAYLDTRLTANTTYSYQVSAVDGAGNVSLKSLSVNATTPLLSPAVQRKIILTLEGAPVAKMNASATIEFLNPVNNSRISQASIITDTSGQYLLNVPSGLISTVTFRLVIRGYLSKILTNVDLRNTAILDVNLPTLPAGDFNSDQSINAVDFSYMNSKWNSADSLADINKDGKVNSLDFSYLSNNWLLAGE